MTELPLEAFIVADVHLLTTAEGGRRSGIASGYRCTCFIGHIQDGKPTYNDAAFYFSDQTILHPGGTARARVRPLIPDSWSHLAVGDRFELSEGPRVIGRAVIVELFPAP